MYTWVTKSKANTKKGLLRKVRIEREVRMSIGWATAGREGALRGLQSFYFLTWVIVKKGIPHPHTLPLGM